MLYRLDDVSKAYGPHEILRGASWQHNPGERVGLVGRNGAGKTTLFRLIAGLDEPDHGEIHRVSSLKIGMLAQHLESTRGTSLFDYVLAAFGDVLRIEEAMRDLEHRLAESAGEDHEALLDRYSKLQHDYEHADGYRIHSEVERVLTGVGFAEQDWDRPVREMSGGQQNRAMLARLLLGRVDLMLLDEPTNHLDLRGIEFLEEFLQSYRGSYLLISHDRTFLNRTVDKIVELAHGDLIEYPGDYDKFLALRGERFAQMHAAWEQQQELIDKTKDFIRRNIAGQKTKQAQSRRKMLDKIELVDRPQTDETLAQFRLDAGPRSGAVALSAEGLDVGWGETVVLTGVDVTVRRGERWAIMGPNGSGKSTLLKTLAGRIAPLAGTVSEGHNVQIGYYDQTLGDLAPQKRVLDEIWDLDHSQSEEDVRDYLAKFSFFDEDAFKKVASLSGGERGRLALAKIMHVGGNLLLLDEPTNHLDVYTREALEKALEGFTGALVVVSHDRYFIDRIADRIYVVEDGTGEMHLGNYSEVVERMKRLEVQAEVAAASAARPQQVRPDARIDRDEQKRRERAQRKIESEIAQIEERIAALEGEAEQDELLLCSPEVYEDGVRVKEIQARGETRRAELEDLYRNWERLARDRENA